MKTNGAIDTGTLAARAWHAGNYAEAYTTRAAGIALEKAGELTANERSQFLLGFFASYESSEIPFPWRATVEALREAATETEKE